MTTRFEVYDKSKEKQEKIKDIINKISEIRINNNKQWMEILKISFKYAPDESKKIFKNITDNDKKINILSKRLCK